MKSNMLTSNDFMHNVKDYVLPIIVLIIIIVLLIFFKRTCIKSAIHNLGGSKTIKSSRNIEHFDVNVDLSTLNTKIHGNLFSGFESRKESDKQLDKVKGIIAKNPEKYKMISPYRNNIFINGNESNKLQKICLGNVEDNCINYDLMKKYDPATNPIPIFVKGTSGDPVYYNHDDTVVKHDKLCILDKNGVTTINNDKYSCIEDKHLDIINGNIAITFKKMDSDNSSNEGEMIKSYNVEYGPYPGFQNVATKTFYMTDKNFYDIQNQFSSLDQGAPGCFSGEQGGRIKHIILKPEGKALNYSGNYYINQQTPDISNYKHIHKHEDS